MLILLFWYYVSGSYSNFLSKSLCRIAHYGVYGISFVEWNVCSKLYFVQSKPSDGGPAKEIWFHMLCSMFCVLDSAEWIIVGSSVQFDVLLVVFFSCQWAFTWEVTEWSYRISVTNTILTSIMIFDWDDLLCISVLKCSLCHELTWLIFLCVVWCHILGIILLHDLVWISLLSRVVQN